MVHGLMQEAPDCQCYYCRNNFAWPEEEEAYEEYLKEKAAGKIKTCTLEELLKEINDV